MKIGTFARSELLLQVELAAVDDDEVRPEREDPLEVGIEQRAHARQRFDLGRIVVEAADRDDLRARADGKEDLGDRRDERDDAGRARRGAARRVRSAGREHGQQREQHARHA